MLKYQVKVQTMDMQQLQKIQQDQNIIKVQADLYIYQEIRMMEIIQQHYKVEKCIIYI